VHRGKVVVMLLRFSHGPETIKLGDLEVRRLGFGAMRLPCTFASRFDRLCGVRDRRSVI